MNDALPLENDALPLEYDTLPLEYKLNYGYATEQLCLADFVDPAVLRELGLFSGSLEEEIANLFVRPEADPVG